MPLKLCSLSSPFPSKTLTLIPQNTNPNFSSPSPSFLPLRSPKTPFSTLLPATPSNSISPSPNPIFLPLLEQHQQLEEEEAAAEVEEIEEDSDPIKTFFKSLSETPDPQREGRLSLQKNRRSSWHIAGVKTLETETDAGEEEKRGELDHSRASSHSSSEEEDEVKGVVGEILRMARNLPENSTLGEFLDPYVGRMSEGECVELLGLMGAEGLIRSCLYLYEWMRLQDPALLTPRACSVLFPALGQAGMGKDLMVLFRNLPCEGQFRDVRVYNAAISGLSCCGRFDDAWKVYDAMETDNILPDHVTCSILITIMRKTGCTAKDAWQFFEKMNRKGVKWSLEVFGALIKSFCDEGLKKEALIIQSEMEKKGISSNTIIYNTLMDAYGKSNHVEEAEGLFVEMKEKGLNPTAATYNILMDAYSRRMQPEIIENLLLEMQDFGLEPNVKSYTCLISAYGRQRKMSDMAADAFLRMKKVGIKPTSHSYTALIHAYSVDGWHEKAYIAFGNMKREGIVPSIETYTALLDAFRRAGDTRTLMETWKSMIKDKIEGTRVTFNILVDGFAKQGQYADARDVISEFGRIGLQPSVMTYNMLMNAYARGGQHSKLPQLLKEMAALNLKPDSITFSTMIYAYVRVRDFKRAFYYHKQMVRSGQVPDARSYEKLRAILDVKAAAKNRRDKSAILGILNSNMGLLKRKKGKKDEFWKNRKKGSFTDRCRGMREHNFERLCCRIKWSPREWLNIIILWLVSKYWLSSPKDDLLKAHSDQGPVHIPKDRHLSYGS
ncbi:pentatricopeptide repeat-containing protein, chloroplastic isoform X1 [Cinnamomum micranthum f. kanehirae]|uniref:Pentatricopeptide repeat-containing protein, chloroplastic isoform X1 n=1 Tax=Cinnamomum micranthum f. kanehirae TaxID=337451 RepID=A0A3S3MNU5_9MAGN|nr:pentatricopeptide repeat-containing protein, chloroplastic isoform X1 [Cinnamomum micranthum f. kanehirae]